MLRNIISELVVIDQKPIVFRGKLFECGLQIVLVKLLLIEEFENVLQFLICYKTIPVFINRTYGLHDFYEQILLYYEVQNYIEISEFNEFFVIQFCQPMVCPEIACCIDCCHILELIQPVLEGLVCFLHFIAVFEIEKWLHGNPSSFLELRLGVESFVKNVFFDFAHFNIEGLESLS